MTILIYRDKVLAADTAIWSGNIIVGHIKNKIRSTPNGYLVGCTGPNNACEVFHEWALRGFLDGDRPAPFDDKDKFAALVVHTDGRVQMFNGRMEAAFYDLPFVAEGSSIEFAYGCLHSGKSAEETVRLMIEHTDAGGGEVVVLRLEDEPAEEEEVLTYDPFAIPLIDDAIAEHRETWREKRGLT